jgi:hypothetical protein
MAAERGFKSSVHKVHEELSASRKENAREEKGAMEKFARWKISTNLRAAEDHKSKHHLEQTGHKTKRRKKKTSRTFVRLVQFLTSPPLMPQCHR